MLKNSFEDAFKVILSAIFCYLLLDVDVAEVGLRRLASQTSSSLVYVKGLCLERIKGNIPDNSSLSVFTQMLRLKSLKSLLSVLFRSP